MKSEVSKVEVAILGSGISGLTVAYKLKGLTQVALFEKSSRAGGLVQTLENDGFLCELGPHSVRTRGTGLHALDLSLKLGLKDEIIFPSKTSQKRYVLHKGKLEELPSSLKDLFKSPLLRGITHSIFKEPFIKKSLLDDESIMDFFSRRFSPKIIDTLIDAFVTGIFAGHCKELSLRSCFPDLFFAEKNYRSMLFWLLFGKKEKILSPLKELQTMGPFFSFKGGMETLTRALQNEVQESLFFEEEAIAIVYDKGWNILFKSGKKVRAKKLVSALPLHALKKLLSPLIPEVSEIFNVPHASLAVVTIGCDTPKEGFGYLVPSIEKSPMLGVIFNCSIFKDQGKSKITAMLGGLRDPDFIKKSDQDILSITYQELSKHLGKITPKYSRIHRLESAIPQYPVGYHKSLQQFSEIAKERLPNFFWTGNGFNGVAVGDLVKHSQILAKQILNCQ